MLPGIKLARIVSLFGILLTTHSSGIEKEIGIIFLFCMFIIVNIEINKKYLYIVS
jgi:hypothetical protein